MEEEHVIIVTHSYPRFDGDWRSNFIESLAVGYRQNGAKVTVLVPLSARWNRAELDSSGIRIIPYRYLPFKSWHVLGYGDSMKGDLKMNPLHILLLPLLMIAGTLRLARLLLYERTSFLHAHWAVPNTLIAIAARTLAFSRVKILSSFPGSDVTVIQQCGRFGKFLAHVIARSDYLSCNSSDLKEDLVAAGIPAAKIDYQIYGVNNQNMRFSAEAREQVRAKLGIRADEIALLMVGRFVAKKGFATGIRAMQHLRSRHERIRLYIIGSGLLESEYRALMKEVGVEDMTTLLGEVLPGELKDYYSACDIFLMPSERLPSDGLNVVVVEAMACARPIVASSVGGNDLVVSAGINGYLHRASDAEDLAEKVALLAGDSSLRQAMGEKSRIMVDEHFNWNAIAHYYLTRYHELLS
jgi:glycosyltransferase involved in cell wall biosynthesis